MPTKALLGFQSFRYSTTKQMAEHAAMMASQVQPLSLLLASRVGAKAIDQAAGMASARPSRVESTTMTVVLKT